ncbi:hypothetical protein PAXRUDRAFT_102602, partial [Paxillus rubicundulus Ve08.2h10]
MFTKDPVNGDGSEWSINEDWEASRGIANDLFTIAVDLSLSKLHAHFTDEPLLLEIIEALHDLDSDKPDWIQRCVRHRALNYLVEDGRLFRITDGRSVRARARVECVSQKEAIELAKDEHSNNRHWGHDLVKIKLMDCIWSPKLDQLIV